MLNRLWNGLKTLAKHVVTGLAERLKQWTQPLAETPVGGGLLDVSRSKSELLAENALLRQQLIVLKRQVKQVKMKDHERLLLVIR